MPGPGQVLREIHRLRSHLKRLQDEIDRAPRQLRTQQTKVARQEEILHEAQETLKKLKVSMRDGEVSLKSIHTQIAKHRKQLNEAGGKKEYDALQAEIASEQQKLQKLEDGILNTMAESDDLAAKIPELEKNLERAKQDLAEFEKNSGQRLADLKSQSDDARQQLQAVEATLPEDIRPQFDRLVAARGEDALALVKDRNCSACYTSITAQNYNDLLNGMFLLCKACGRILYLRD